MILLENCSAEKSYLDFNGDQRLHAERFLIANSKLPISKSPESSFLKTCIFLLRCQVFCQQDGGWVVIGQTKIFEDIIFLQDF